MINYVLNNIQSKMSDIPGFNSNANISLVNINPELSLPLNIRGSNEEKIKQIFKFLKEKKENETDKEIILKTIEACKCHETKVTRFLKINKFSLFEREINKNTHIKD